MTQTGANSALAVHSIQKFQQAITQRIGGRTPCLQKIISEAESGAHMLRQDIEVTTRDPIPNEWVFFARASLASSLDAASNRDISRAFSVDADSTSSAIVELLESTLQKEPPTSGNVFLVRLCIPTLNLSQMRTFDESCS